MRRFQIYQNWYFGRGARAYELNNLRKLDWHCAAQIRDLYNILLGGGGSRLTDRQLLDCKRSAEALVRVRGRQAGCWSAWTQGMRLSMREFCQPLTRRVSVWAR